jgi:DNA-binding NarL/FixJ family response regulator
VLVADGQEIVRIGIKSLLTECGGHEVCGEAADGPAAIERTQELSPDVVLLDVVLPHLNGLEVARQILAHNPQTSVLLFTDTQSEQIMRETLRLGIRGFVSKSDRMCDLTSAIDAVLHGGAFFTSRVAPMLLHFAKQQDRPGILSAREREIVQLIAEGHCTKNMAELLTMSVKTVETHRTNAMRKLDIHSTAQLILYAIRNEIVYMPTMAFQSITANRLGPVDLGGYHRQLASSPAA